MRFHGEPRLMYLEFMGGGKYLPSVGQSEQKQRRPSDLVGMTEGQAAEKH